MSNSPVPRPASAPVQDDGDNRYKTVQSKLKRLAAALDNATDEMTPLQRRLRANADRAETVAGHIAHAELDRKFIEMTNAVSVALGGSAVEAHRMHEKVQDVAAAAHDARQTHAKRYGPLDEVRSGRKERTPKPAFFTR